MIVFNGKEGLKVIVRFAIVDGILMVLRGCVVSVTSVRLIAIVLIDSLITLGLIAITVEIAALIHLLNVY